MTRYYFDVREGGDLSLDDEGYKLGSLKAAWTEAARSIAEMARDKIPADGKSDLQLAIEVRSDHGPVLAVRISFKTEGPHDEG
jgi:hypothetical protein